MKIVSVISKSYPLRGGAQISNFQLLRRLSREFGHRCSVYTPAPFKKTIIRSQVVLSTFRDTAELNFMLQKAKPDIIFTSLEVAGSAMKAAKKFNLPVILFVCSCEQCPPSRSERKQWKVSLNREYPSDAETVFLLQEADAIIANCKYLQERLRKAHNTASKVSSYDIEKDSCLIRNFSPSPKGYITGACGAAYKGADIFYGLAKIFRKEKFLLVGNVDPRYRSRFAKRKNILILPFSSQKKLLKMSKVMLVPSQLPEPIARIGLEAMANSIPTLVSFSGGFKEIVGGLSIGVRGFRNVLD